MKKTTITLSCDEEKLSALRLYLAQKDMSLETELTVAVENLYQKNVPANVREFIDLRAGIEKPAEKKKAKPSASEFTTKRGDDICETNGSV